MMRFVARSVYACQSSFCLKLRSLFVQRACLAHPNYLSCCLFGTKKRDYDDVQNCGFDYSLSIDDSGTIGDPIADDRLHYLDLLQSAKAKVTSLDVSNDSFWTESVKFIPEQNSDAEIIFYTAD
jgi:hypothetical protein